MPFLVKLALFALAGLLSLVPTREFLSWRPALRAGRAPAIDAARLRQVRLCIHLEATLVAAILLCAALMARGVGYFG